LNETRKPIKVDPLDYMKLAEANVTSDTESGNKTETEEE
jgi:hypothetical protein